MEKNLFTLVNQFIEENKYAEAIEQLNKLQKQYPKNGEIFVKRADLFYKLQKYSDALNDYTQSLKYDIKQSDKVKAKIEMITNIIKYQGSDIYAATNLHNDPWLDE
jgi:tetratricopeptide (TPR) repeat protein